MAVDDGERQRVEGEEEGMIECPVFQAFSGLDPSRKKK